jgi:lysophospholipase L1-like esterase
MSVRLPLLAVALVAALLLPAAAQAKHTSTKQQLYVSLGDSYASGWDPSINKNTKDGFVYQVPGLAKKRGYNLKVVNFGCGGATTVSLLTHISCPKGGLGPGGTAYPKTTQIAAATKFIKAHRKQIALITVSISGNDVTACVKAPNPITCVSAAQKTINDNVGNIAKQLRKAAGSKPKIVGTTYPDVILGAWVRPGGASAQTLAAQSQLAFKLLINPSLKKGYAEGKASFVDVTAATGGYDSLKTLVDDPTFGSIPKPVATICTIGYFCTLGDIHLKRAGYRVISTLVAKELPKKKAAK